MEKVDAVTGKEDSSLSRAWRVGSAAALHNLKPAIALWLFGVVLIVSYYFVPSLREGLNWIAEFKSRTGWIFAAISTSICAGLFPVLINRIFGSSLNGKRQGVLYLVSNLLFWAFKGVEVDLLYRFQAWLFGDDSKITTILSKVAFDQLVYCPLLGLLTVVLFYIWRENGFQLAGFFKGLGDRWYRNKILPVLISNWFVWVPACAIIYFLPLGLQLPIQNLILCFWVLILTFFTEKEPAENPN